MFTRHIAELVDGKGICRSVNAEACERCTITRFVLQECPLEVCMNGFVNSFISQLFVVRKF